MKVIIVRPHGYYGGTLALDKFCSLLREKGVDAKLFYTQGERYPTTNMLRFWIKWLRYTLNWSIYYWLSGLFPNSQHPRIKGWRTTTLPVDGVKRQVLPFFCKNKTIVIYPEKTYGNFLGAKNVIRWLLYHYAYSNDKKAYNDTDVFICFRKYFNDWILNPKGYTVTINYFDSKLYRKYNDGERNGNCYFVRKGSERLDLPATFDGPILDNLPEEEKVMALNKYKYCISYDTQTFYSTIASVCGCISIVALEPGKTKNDYLGPDEDAFGVAYGFSDEEISNSLRTREMLLKKLDYTARNEENIQEFFRIIDKEFHVSLINYD